MLTHEHFPVAHPARLDNDSIVHVDPRRLCDVRAGGAYISTSWTPDWLHCADSLAHAHDACSSPRRDEHNRYHNVAPQLLRVDPCFLRTRAGGMATNWQSVNQSCLLQAVDQAVDLAHVHVVGPSPRLDEHDLSCCTQPQQLRLGQCPMCTHAGYMCML